MAAPQRNNSTIDTSAWDVNVEGFIGYNGSPNLKAAGVTVNFTPEMIEEYQKCAADPIYFAEKYIKIVHVDRGLIPIELYEYQKEIITKAHDNRNLAINASRQCGKCCDFSSVIRVRNKITGEIVEIQAGDFHNLLK